MAVDVGVKRDTFFADNDNSSTRFRFTGSADVSPGLKAGVLWVVEYQGNDSDLVNMPGTPGGDDEIRDSNPQPRRDRAKVVAVSR
jgi:hypothetical protein